MWYTGFLKTLRNFSTFCIYLFQSKLFNVKSLGCFPNLRWETTLLVCSLHLLSLLFLYQFLSTFFCICCILLPNFTHILVPSAVSFNYLPFLSSMNTNDNCDLLTLRSVSKSDQSPANFPEISTLSDMELLGSRICSGTF